MVRIGELPCAATIFFEPTSLASGRGLADEVAERLGDAILRGRLSPGQHVPELQVAEELGISRAPVREAARILAERGLLVSEPRQGFFVPELGLADLDDIYRLRIALECAAIQMMCDRRKVTDLAAVKARRTALDQAAEQNSSTALLSADLAFHAKIVEASGSPRLIRAYATLTGELQLVLRLVKGLYPEPQAYAATHDQIMAILELWDGDATQAALDRHIRIGWTEVRDAYANVIGTGSQAPTATRPGAQRRRRRSLILAAS